MTPVQWSKRLGRYDLASTKKQWCVQLRTPAGKWINALWDEADEPDVSGPPSEVAELLRDRVASYLYRGEQAEDVTNLNAIIADAEAVDAAWAEDEAAQLEKKAAYLRNRYPRPRSPMVEMAESILFGAAPRAEDSR